MKDPCVLCGIETAYDETTHIDMRNSYVEGVGQLCSSCYLYGSNRKHILVSEATIMNTPNNSELGSKVREIYYEAKN